jgi:hypothetical protein
MSVAGSASNVKAGLFPFQGGRDLSVPMLFDYIRGADHGAKALDLVIPSEVENGASRRSDMDGKAARGSDE